MGPTNEAPGEWPIKTAGPSTAKRPPSDSITARDGRYTEHQWPSWAMQGERPCPWPIMCGLRSWGPGVRLFTVPGCPKPTMGNRWIHARAEGMKDGCGGEWPGQSLQNGASSCACLWVEAGEWKHAFSSDGWAGNHAQQRWAAERACWPGCLFPLGFRGLGGFVD